MILLRQAKISDIPGLDRLSSIAAEKHPGFLNVPSNPESWEEKIKFSQSSFSGKLPKGQIGKYIFVAVDLDSNTVQGVSMVTEQHGTPESPHFYFQVGTEQKYSATINAGIIHGTLNLKTDVNGPTEIGGLLVDPEVRNQEERIGRQISFVRFMYIGIHRQKFRDRVLAELLPPLTKKGKSPIWEAVGRRFTNMDYWEADYLSSKNKEFILSLFPSDTVYVTFLPAEARNAIGKVSKDTEPVMHMLKKIGFEYQNQVDPFDGGPHLMAKTENIKPLQNINSLVYGGELPSFAEGVANDRLQPGMLSKKQEASFEAVSASVLVEGEEIFFDKKRAELLNIKKNDPVYFMPYY